MFFLLYNVYNQYKHVYYIKTSKQKRQDELENNTKHSEFTK